MRRYEVTDAHLLRRVNDGDDAALRELFVVQAGNDCYDHRQEPPS